MSKGTYEEFRDALRAFESGWDRERYENGQIADWQLDQWAGGSVGEHFPQYTSWGQLSDEEWDAMSYQSMNSLGFVGYQFGEALLIDLGYYDDDQFYGNGASTNTWDGTWTGKNGVNSLEEFMTKEAQEIAIQEAFGHNLQILENGLEQQGKSLDDFIGTTTTYVQNGQEITVELTLTGIMAAAHLRGAYGTLNLLLNGAVSTDEYGTSILRYVDQFGGYDGPNVDEAIAFYEDRKTGDEGLGTPGGGNTGGGNTGGGTTGGGGSDGFDNAAITKENADVVVTWSYGSTELISDFDPANDTLFIDWVGADALDITETAEGLVFAIPSNNQTLTLQGVKLEDLQSDNINALDATARAELAELIGDDGNTGGGGTPTPTNVVISLTSADQTIDGFDLAEDTITLESGVTADRLEIFETANANGSISVSIVIRNDNGILLSTTVLRDIALDDLSTDNFVIAEHSAEHEVEMLLDDDHGGMTGTMTTITLTSGSQTIASFNPAHDMVHIEGGIIADRLEIFEESGDALGLTTRIVVTEADGTVVSTTILQGVGLSDLSMANFSIAEQSAQNEVAGAIGASITPPSGGGGYDVVYDSDGSNPRRPQEILMKVA